MLMDRARQRALLFDRSRPQRRSRDHEPLAQDRHHVNLRLHAALPSDDHETAVHRQRVDVSTDVVTGDHIEHDVDATAVGQVFDAGDEIRFAIVDRPLRAKRFARRALLRAPGCSEYAGAQSTRQLDGRGADPARAAMNEDRLAGREPSALDNVRPDRERRFWYCGGMRDIQATWRGKTLRRWHRAEFRVAAARNERTDHVAWTPGGDGGTHRFDRPRYFKARNVGDAVGRWIPSLPLQNVRSIHARRGDFDEHVVRPD